MTYKITVIVPVYNVENYLPQCLESILNQTLKDLEIICINDGSKDSSKCILENYKKQDSRIIIVDKANGGYGAACNIGLRLAQGDYISIVEPDDYTDKNMYEDLYNLAEHYQVDMVKSAFYEHSDDTETQNYNVTKINWSQEYKMPEKVFRLKDFSQFLYFHPSIWSCIYRKDFLRKHNIFFKEAEGAGWVDNPFQVKTFCLADKIYYTDNAYYYYRLTNPTSSSNIVNISNPFDRSDEIHDFLSSKKIKDKNILAYLYKRELGYIETVLGGLPEELFTYASDKIKQMTMRMDKNVILKHNRINEHELNVYKHCHKNEDLITMMHEIKQSKKGVSIVNSAS